MSPPPIGLTVSGRPLLNLTLAVNYALGGLNPWGYHAINLAIHILAALTLFGVLRRTLAVWGVGCGVRGEESHDTARSTSRTPHPTPHTFLAFAIALLWAVHPLQTELVTYIVQRAESLCGLFYLLTLYCFIRGASRPPSPGRRTSLWYLAAVVFCFLGIATKEVMVTAPVMVFLYDRTFFASSFRQSLRQRKWCTSAWPRHGCYWAIWWPRPAFFHGGANSAR